MNRVWRVLAYCVLGCLLSIPYGWADVLEKQWESDGFKQPESVRFDSKRNIFYVTNIAGKPTDKDGIGFISRLSPEGKILDREWVKGLQAPKGMAIANDILYVADIDQLVAIDIATAKIIARHIASGAVFLNDVAADPAANVYVSDMMTDTIHCLCQGKFQVWLKDPKLASPNGLYVDKDRLIVGSWGERTEGFNTKVPGHMLAISLRERKITPLGSDAPIGNLDGVEADDDNGFYVTDWMAGKLFHIAADAKVTLLLSLDQGAADLAYLNSHKLLVIPLMNHDKVVAYHLKN